MRLVILYPPFCPPTMMPYSPAYLKDFVGNNLSISVDCVDLNARFHVLRFPDLYVKLRASSGSDAISYGALLAEFEASARPLYTEMNDRVVSGGLPDFFDELLGEVLAREPDVVAVSLVYSSQCFFGLALIDALKKRGVECVAGGPAVNAKVRDRCLCLKDEVALVSWLAERGGLLGEGELLKVGSQDAPSNLTIKKWEGDDVCCDTVPDFSDFRREEYFSRDVIIPLKTCSTCFYKQCAFCTHFADMPYLEFNLGNIKRAIIRSGAKYIFFIDDMITKPRLLEIAECLKGLGVGWWCQLRPTKDLLGVFPVLYASGLRAVCWGLESGNQRVLDLMRKGTRVDDAKGVLRESHEAGIKNMVYVLFGFPSETKAEFLDTIDFLKANRDYIFVVSPSVFGLQRGAKVFVDPDRFGVRVIQEETRLFLEGRVSYEVSSGLTHDEARRLRGRFSKTLKGLNRVPAVFKDYKEQILLIE